MPASTASLARSIDTYFVTAIILISSGFRFDFSQAAEIFSLMVYKFSATFILLL